MEHNKTGTNDGWMGIKMKKGKMDGKKRKGWMDEWKEGKSDGWVKNKWH